MIKTEKKKEIERKKERKRGYKEKRSAVSEE